MNKYKTIVDAKFWRDPYSNYIKVYFDGGAEPMTIWANLIDQGAIKLGDRDLEQVISILSRDRATMLKQRNFPQIYEEMLSDLIEAQRERYGVKKVQKEEMPYECSLTLYEIEGLIKEQYNLKSVHIDRVLAGDASKAEWTYLDEKDRIMYIHYFGEKK